jgi:hypothetical protein
MPFETERNLARWAEVGWRMEPVGTRQNALGRHKDAVPSPRAGLPLPSTRNASAVTTRVIARHGTAGPWPNFAQQEATAEGIAPRARVTDAGSAGCSPPYNITRRFFLPTCCPRPTRVPAGEAAVGNQCGGIGGRDGASAARDTSGAGARVIKVHERRTCMPKQVTRRSACARMVLLGCIWRAVTLFYPFNDPKITLRTVAKDF